MSDKALQVNKLVIKNASAIALSKTQQAFQGVAEELGIKDEQDVVDMVKEIRMERQESNDV